MKTKHIYLVWFIALLPAMILRDLTLTNELRYLSIVDEALRNGTYSLLQIRVLFIPTSLLYIWLMMIGKVLLLSSQVFVVTFIYSALVTLITMTKWIRKENGVNEHLPCLC